ncbi:MAG: hypothetical protein V2A79_10500, partial [Planctomycetota bacterium]
MMATHFLRGTGMCALTWQLILAGCSSYTVHTELNNAHGSATPPKSIAIMPMECADSSLGIAFADSLSLGFLKRGYEVAERAKLSLIFTEQDLCSAALIDREY